jgi:hypothetical protein
MMCGVPLYKQLSSFLNDTETKYLQLLSAKMWKGVKANSTREKLAFKLVGGEYEDYQANVVKNGSNAIPFDEWVKTVNCHHWGKRGHIHPTCPLYLDNIKSSKIVPGQGNARKGCFQCCAGPSPQGYDCPTKFDQPAWKNKPNFKAFLSALNNILGKCDKDPKSDNEAKDTTDDNNNDTSTKASAAFLASLGLPEKVSGGFPWSS